jgi:hypothetical protein
VGQGIKNSKLYQKVFPDVKPSSHLAQVNSIPPNLSEKTSHDGIKTDSSDDIAGIQKEKNLLVLKKSHPPRKLLTEAELTSIQNMPIKNGNKDNNSNKI